MKPLLPTLAFAAFAVPMALPAQSGRTSSAIVYGNDPCPKDEGDEIVVCARKPERERYRIPKELRHEGEALSEQSWGARSRALDEVARSTVPGSCSPVGSYGQSGCRQQLLRQWYAERRAGSGMTLP